MLVLNILKPNQFPIIINQQRSKTILILGAKRAPTIHQPLKNHHYLITLIKINMNNLFVMSNNNNQSKIPQKTHHQNQNITKINSQ